MFDAPVDALYLWVGLAAASAAAFGVVLAMPTTAPPDAGAVAETVDAVAASPHEATGQHPLDASAVKLDPHQVGLGTDDGTTYAPFRHGPVVPVEEGSRLDAVLRGDPPERAFPGRDAFRAAVQQGRNETGRWREADGPLVVRRVTWGEVDATLVGA